MRLHLRFMKVSFAILSIALTVMPRVTAADAEPLTLFQLDSFARYLGCLETGSDSSTCPEENIRWEKDLLDGIGGDDYRLALREFWDDGELTYVCYRNRNGDTLSNIDIEPSACGDDCAVVPHSLCDAGASKCLETGRSTAECEDVDGDGIRRWQEDAIGSSDHVVNNTCDMNEPASCGFAMACGSDHKYAPDPDFPNIEVPVFDDPAHAICVPRENCAGDSCTAFHLEVASINNNELIVYVVFDYAPVPPTILDLYVDYDFNFMTLVDARLMKDDDCTDEIGLCNKELATSHPSDNRLRLTVLSPNSNSTIPMDRPIIELVFDRTAHGQTRIAFTGQDHLQIESMAPDQGEDGTGEPNLNELADDALWGEAVQIPAVDPNGPRLLLYYSFDNAADYLDYADVKNGAELCDLVGECSVLSENDDYQREQKEIYQAKLNVLQRGTERVSEQISHGVIGPGGYLDGKTDHLEFPVTVNDPKRDQDGHYYYDQASQSFSLSTWFYSEGDGLEVPEGEAGQVIFSRNSYLEETKFGVSVKMAPSADDPNVRVPTLFWFSGPVAEAPTLQRISSDFNVLEWTHLGLVFHDAMAGEDDDGDGVVDEVGEEVDRISFFIDGKPVALSYPNIDDDHDGDTDEAGELSYDLPFKRNGGSGTGTDKDFKLECPAPDRTGGLLMHEEGQDVGPIGSPGAPEVLFFASAKNNQYGIETMDLYGFERTELIRDDITSAKELDYSPFLDKIVYSSNKNDHYEIWIADGDGSNPKQITKGFGDTSRGIFARRPRWAPDGTAIIFDSNVYSLEYMDNIRARTYQLYYIQYDRVRNEVAVPLEDGGASTMLDYDFIIANQTVSFYRLTSNPMRNAYNAVWIDGKSSERKGRIWFNSASDKHDDREIKVLTIPSVISGGEGTDIFENNPDSCLVKRDPGTDDILPDFNAEYRLFDGYSRTVAYGKNDVVESQIAFSKEWVTYVDAAEAIEDTSGSPFVFDDIDATADEVRFSVYLDTTAYDCFDVNSSCDSDARGCLPDEIPELYIRYDDVVVRSDVSDTITGKDPSDSGNNITASGADGLGKTVKVYDQPTSTEQFVKIRAGSELNSKPLCLPNNPLVFLARLSFTAAPGQTITAHSFGDLFEAKIRKTHQAIGIADMNAESGMVETLGQFHQDALSNFVKDMAFSPDGNRLVMHGIENARPVVVVQEVGEKSTDNMYNAYMNEEVGFVLSPLPDGCELPEITFKKISGAPMNVDGLSWEKIERFYPCNWIGAHKERDSKLYQNGFRGGMDELKLFSYARDPRGFLSDYERGHAWLEKEKRDKTLPAKTMTCSDHYDCPEYMLCMPNGTNGNECRPQPCDMEAAMGEPGSCACETSGDTICGVTGRAGVCTLMPIPAAHGQAAPEEDENGQPVDPTVWQWDTVCVAECVSDTQCFKEECSNGPCRFCDDNACHECRVGERTIGSDIKREIQGCPDRNSWDCVDGTCVTECYAFENGESIYLCDPALEYCRQGRCRMFDWDWTDISPMTFSSIGDMGFGSIDPTVAIDQRYPVRIIAYGVEDYLTPPELLVEGMARGNYEDLVYERTWFKIGHVQVYNKNENEAQDNPYVIYTPVPISDLRIRLVQPLLDNPTASATGLGFWDQKRCNASGGCKTCMVWGDTVSTPSNGCAASVCMKWDDPYRPVDAPPASCTQRAPGSRATIGYPIGISTRQSRRACDRREMGSCHYHDNDFYANQYLNPGQTAAIVLGVEVAGTSAKLEQNHFCPYTSAAGRELGNDYLVADELAAMNTEVPTYTRNVPTEDGRLVSIPVTKRIIYGTTYADELSNQASSFYYVAGGFPEGNSTPLTKSPSESEAILNCNYNSGNGDPYNREAVAVYSICPRSLNECFDTLYKTTGRDGAINESANGCAIERGMRRTPCYEFVGSDVTLDFMTYTPDSKEPWRTLDFDLQRSFGYDEGTLKEESEETTQNNQGPVL